DPQIPVIKAQITRQIEVQFAEAGVGDAVLKNSLGTALAEFRGGALVSSRIVQMYWDDNCVHFIFSGAGEYTLELTEGCARVRVTVGDPGLNAVTVREYTALNAGRTVHIGSELGEIYLTDGDGNTVDETVNGEEALIWSIDRFGKLILTGRGGLEDTPGLSASWLDFEEFIEELRIESEPVRVGSYSLGGLTELTYTGLPDSARSVGAYSMSGSGLVRLDVPATVERLEPNAFAGLTSLTDVYFYGSEEKWAEIGGYEAGLGAAVKVHFYESCTLNVGRQIEDLCVEYHSTSQGYTSYRGGINFDFDWLDEGAGTYRQEFAIVSVALALSGMEADDNRYFGSRGTEPARNLLGQMGFATTPDEGFYEKGYGRSDDPEVGTIGVIITKREIDGATYLAICLRGGGYGGGGWAGDFDVGKAGPHAGFDKAADYAEACFLEYAQKYGIDTKNAHIWLTGFSRSAATANLLSGKLRRDGLCQTGNIYTYTFATPNNDEASAAAYGDIFNIVNPVDLVPMVPFEAWRMGKQGTTIFLPQDYNLQGIALNNEFREKFSKISGAEYDVAFHQEAILKGQLIKMITDAIGRKGFVDTIQKPLMQILATGDVRDVDTLLCNACSFSDLLACAALFDDGHFIQGLSELHSIAGAIVAARWRRYGKDDPVAKLLKGVDGIILGALQEALALIDLELDPSLIRKSIALMLANDVSNIRLILLIIDLIQNQVTKTQMMIQHWPEVYLSWLLVTDEAEIIAQKRYKTVVLRCPVDIEVYDAQGSLVGRTVTEYYEAEDEDGVSFGFYASSVDENVTTIPMLVI
ncbi:MAG: hypothetical protein K6C09_09285, partial [Oscillospiraceae bacterium]|nr:hypothetical protein [Oscillospiraceae bacterium]